MRRVRGLVGVAAGSLLGCAAAANPTPTVVAPAAAHPDVEPGLGLVSGAPPGVVVTIEASDNRMPLVSTRALGADNRVAIPAGFIVVTLSKGEHTRVLEVYAEANAAIQYEWAGRKIERAQGVRQLDRAAALEQAESSLRAIMAVRADPAAMDTKLAEQRRQIEALGSGPEADLARLLHATFAVQLRGPEDAWSVIEGIPADSIAWAAYSERMLELRVLMNGLSEAEARFAEVRTQVPDIGLQAALRAGDLHTKETSREDDDAAAAHAARMTMAGSPEEGAPMPEFTLVDFDSGTALHNDDFAGAPYLIELWSTWCKPCVQDMAELHALHDDAGDRLRIVSVAVGDSRQPVVEFRRDRWPMPWTNVWAPDGAPIFAAWNTRSVPFAVLVDVDGIVIQAGRGLKPTDVRAALGLD